MNRYAQLFAVSLAALLLFSGCRQVSSLAEDMSAQFQETIDQQREELRLPGVSAAVILPNGTAWLGVSGKSADGQAMDSSNLFGLGSVSKTYIAALVVQLVEEGALSVDDVVRDWIPGLGHVSGDITVHQLLNHTSGLYRYQQSPEYLSAIYAQPDRVWAAEEIMEEFQGKPECLPAVCWGESAMDYILLGMIIENATDTSVSSQLATRLLQPLNLEHTYLYPEQMYPAEMMAHMWLDSTGSGDPVDIMEGSGNLPLAGLFSSLWTSGAIHATAEDLALFVKNLFEGRVITQSALAQMVAPGPELSPDTHYGYSVVVDQVAGKPAYWHSGGAGYSSVYFYFPEERLTIVVLSNLMADLRPIAVGLHDAYTEQQ